MAVLSGKDRRRATAIARRKGSLSIDLLNAHSGQIVQVHRDSLDLVEQVGRRLKRWLRMEGKDWRPNEEFMSAFSIHSSAAKGLVAEGRQLEKAKNASNLSDRELQEALRSVAGEVLAAMSAPEFNELLEVRAMSIDPGEGERGPDEV